MRPTREAAIDAQAEALDAFYIDGIQHNIPFLAALMQHPRWRKGELSTGFIAEEFPDGFKPRAPEGEELQVLAAVAAAIDHLNNIRRREITDQMAGRPVRFAARRVVALGKVMQRVKVEGALGGPVTVSLLDADGKVANAGTRQSDWWPGQPGVDGHGARQGRCRCRCARSSTAMTSPIAASTSRRASTPSARRRSPP